jgi:hypothetical protein
LDIYWNTIRSSLYSPQNNRIRVKTGYVKKKTREKTQQNSESVDCPGQFIDKHWPVGRLQIVINDNKLNVPVKSIPWVR